jgi:cell division protein FtsB
MINKINNKYKLYRTTNSKKKVLSYRIVGSLLNIFDFLLLLQLFWSFMFYEYKKFFFSYQKRLERKK